MTTGPQRPDYTADQICDGIASALKERDFPAVVSLLTMLAVRDPARAQVVYDAMRGEGMFDE